MISQHHVRKYTEKKRDPRIERHASHPDCFDCRRASYLIDFLPVHGQDYNIIAFARWFLFFLSILTNEK